MQTSEQTRVWHLLETSKWLFNESFCKLLFPSASLGYRALSSKSEIQGNNQLHFPSLWCWPSLHFQREIWFSDSSSVLLSIHSVQYTKMYFFSQEIIPFFLFSIPKLYSIQLLFLALNTRTKRKWTLQRYQGPKCLHPLKKYSRCTLLSSFAL